MTEAMALRLPAGRVASDRRAAAAAAQRLVPSRFHDRLWHCVAAKALGPASQQGLWAPQAENHHEGLLHAGFVPRSHVAVRDAPSAKITLTKG